MCEKMSIPETIKYAHVQRLYMKDSVAVFYYLAESMMLSSVQADYKSYNMASC